MVNRQGILIRPDWLAERTLLVLSKWERGIVVASTKDPSIAMYLWFWEWNMFDAIHQGRHTHGTYRNEVEISADQQSAAIVTDHGLRLSLQDCLDGTDMDLEVTNCTATTTRTMFGPLAPVAHAALLCAHLYVIPKLRRMCIITKHVLKPSKLGLELVLYLLVLGGSVYVVDLERIDIEIV